MQKPFRIAVFCIIAFFGLVFATSLPLQYVEGDDSRSVVSGLLGFDNPYFVPMPYHSMTDAMLALLPKQEPIVRKIALGGSALFSVTFLLLLARLVWHWGKECGISKGVIAAVMAALPILIPEFVFLSLVFEPLLIAMTMVLGAHLIVRPVFTQSSSKRSNRLYRLIGSALLFGFGVSFRWDAGFYGSVIFADCVLAGVGHLNKVRTTALAAGWGCGAILATIGSLTLSGYPPSSILETLQWARTTVESGPPLWIQLLYGIATFTPTSVILLAAGVWITVRARNWRVYLLALAGSPIFLLLGIVTFWIKGLFTVVPALLLLMLIGANALRETFSTKSRRTRRSVVAALAIITLAPWLIGVQWPGRMTSRGPGFELTDSPSKPHKERPRIVFGSGVGVPTPEGLRSLWGFGHVFFGGDWRQYVTSMNKQWHASIDDAVERGIPIHSDTDTGIFIARLHQKGYELTTDREPITSPGAPAGAHHRFLRHTETGKKIEILLFSGLGKRLEEKDAMTRAFSDLGHTEIVIVYVFPSRLWALEDKNQPNVRPTGPLTAVWAK